MSLKAIFAKFTDTLSKKADAETDWLSPEERDADPTLEGDVVKPELTEEMDEIIQDTLSLVILLQRAFQEFGKGKRDSKDEPSVMARQLVDNALLDLEDIEDAMQSPDLLNFDINIEAGLIDTSLHNAQMLKSVLDLTLDGGKKAAEFKDLDNRAYKWIGELIDNMQRLYDKAMAQSKVMEEVFSPNPTRMQRQVDEDVDSFSEEDIHPDFSLAEDAMPKAAASNASELIRVAMRFDAWLAGLNAGEDELEAGNFGDPKVAWETWCQFLKDDGQWLEPMEYSFDQFRAGYDKAWVLAHADKIIDVAASRD